MSNYYIAKEVKLEMSIQVEADSYEEAVAIVEDAWENDETFANNYLTHAAVFEDEVHSGTPADYNMTFEELCGWR